MTRPRRRVLAAPSQARGRASVEPLGPWVAARRGPQEAAGAPGDGIAVRLAMTLPPRSTRRRHADGIALPRRGTAACPPAADAQTGRRQSRRSGAGVLPRPRTRSRAVLIRSRHAGHERHIALEPKDFLPPVRMKCPRATAVGDRDRFQGRGDGQMRRGSADLVGQRPQPEGIFRALAGRGDVLVEPPSFEPPRLPPPPLSLDSPVVAQLMPKPISRGDWLACWSSVHWPARPACANAIVPPQARAVNAATRIVAGFVRVISLRFRFPGPIASRVGPCRTPVSARGDGPSARAYFMSRMRTTSWCVAGTAVYVYSRRRAQGPRRGGENNRCATQYTKYPRRCRLRSAVTLSSQLRRTPRFGRTRRSGRRHAGPPLPVGSRQAEEHRPERRVVEIAAA